MPPSTLPSVPSSAQLLEPVAVPPPRPEWVISASVGAVIAILLAALVAWRMSDTSLLPTVESLGGPDDPATVATVPEPPPVEVPTVVEADPAEDEVDDELAEPEGSAAPADSAALPDAGTPRRGELPDEDEDEDESDDRGKSPSPGASSGQP